MFEAARADSRARGIRTAGLIVALVSNLTAQPEPRTAAPQSTAPEQKPLPPGRVVLDEMAAVVGGYPIWIATLQEEFDAVVSGLESGGEVVDPARKQRLWNEILASRLQQRMLAHGAMTLGIATPEQVDQYVQDYVSGKEKDLVQQFGGRIELMNELELQDRSWKSYKDEFVRDALTSLAINESIFRRLDGQAPLFITPKEIREYYERNRERWVHGPVARLEVVAFLSGSNGHGASQDARAQAASKAWTEGASAEEVADQFGGIVATATGDWVFGSDMEDSRAPFYGEFALQNPEGTVSPPISREGTIWVLRVSSREEGSSLSFEDPTVQAEIQTALQEVVYGQLRYETLVRSQSRTYVWPPSLRDR